MKSTKYYALTPFPVSPNGEIPRDRLTGQFLNARSSPWGEVFKNTIGK